MTEFYAIIHRPTGKWLPQSDRAKTHVFPTFNKVPRLFLKKRHAERALKEWLKGKFVARYDWETGEFEGFDPVPDPRRKPEEMKVIPCRLEVDGEGE